MTAGMLGPIGNVSHATARPLRAGRKGPRSSRAEG
jgi:hypothetical protein